MLSAALLLISVANVLVALGCAMIYEETRCAGKPRIYAGVLALVFAYGAEMLAL